MGYFGYMSPSDNSTEPPEGLWKNDTTSESAILHAFNFFILTVDQVLHPDCLETLLFNILHAVFSCSDVCSSPYRYKSFIAFRSLLSFCNTENFCEGLNFELKQQGIRSPLKIHLQEKEI